MTVYSETRSSSPDRSASRAEAVVDIRDLGCRLGPDLWVMIDALNLDPGEVLVLDSPSGTGKSTVLGLIAGVVPATETPARRHVVCGRALALPLPEGQALDATEAGFVLQTSTLVPYLTVSQNIRLPGQIARKHAAEDWLATLDETLGLAGLGARLPGQISVGQRQRVAIARAMATRPRLLLLDEPVSALDPANVRQVETLILQLARSFGAAVILASHQVSRSAFADAPRATQTTIKSSGITYSRFGPPGPGQEGRA